MAEPTQAPRDSGSLGTGVLDPRAFERFSAEKATVMRVYGDQDVSVVVWNLEPGQENPLHVHQESAHAIIVLEGSGESLQADAPPVPIKEGECIIVPRGRTHGVRNSGRGRLAYLAVTTLREAGYVRDARA